MSWNIRPAAAAAALAALLMLTACTTEPPALRNTTPASVAPTTGAEPVAEVIASGTQVATATFSPRPGSDAAGSFEVVASADPGVFEIVTKDLVGPAGSELTLLPYSIPDSETCADTGFRFSLGSLESLGTGPLLMLPDLTRGDPSFFGSAVLTVYSDADREQNDCLATVVASAPITWTMSPRRPDLDVTDAGPVTGASGSTTTDASGAVTGYTVAAGDSMSGIADRFGLTIDDLFYLNPSRTPGPQDPTAYADEVLNLSPSER